MKYKVPTFHSTRDQADIDERALIEIDKRKSRETFNKSLSNWSLFWFVFSLISYVLVARFYPNSNTNEMVGYIDLMFGAFLVYTNTIGGSRFITGGGLVNHKILLKAHLDSRKRVRTKWLGPVLGMVIGVIMLITSAF